MTFLLAAVVFLGYDDAKELALGIVHEPKLGRPAPGEKDTLNALLPAPFFEYQDALTRHAKELAEAAATRNKDRLGAAFGALSQTCVACHAAYLESDAEQKDESGALDAVSRGGEPGPDALSGQRLVRTSSQGATTASKER
jgi:hypothetical protein